jgi:hypothetical protein
MLGNDIFWASAFVYIKFSGDIESLVEKLGCGLAMPDFVVKIRENSPYDKMAEFEVMGFEGWLEETSEIAGYAFRLRLETVHCLQEHVQGRMHDLSPWLARFVTEI